MAGEQHFQLLAPLRKPVEQVRDGRSMFVFLPEANFLIDELNGCFRLFEQVGMPVQEFFSKRTFACLPALSHFGRELRGQIIRGRAPAVTAGAPVTQFVVYGVGQWISTHDTSTSRGPGL